MCRVIQYFIKFFAPIVAAQGGARYLDLKDRLDKLSGNMSLTRKVLRFGCPIPLFLGILNRLKENEKKPQRMVFTRTISDTMLILYFLTDHPLYFQRIGFAKFSKSFMSKCEYINNIFWLINSVLDMMCDIVDLYYIQKEIQALVTISFIH